MTLWLLPNTAGDVSAFVQLGAGISDAAGYLRASIFGGSRSEHYQLNGATSDSHTLAPTSANNPAGAADMFGTHVVVARMDWSLNNQAGLASIRLNYSPGMGGGTQTAIPISAVTTADLVGPTRQDYVRQFTRVGATQWLWRHLYNSTTGGQYCKLFISDGFHFGVGPTKEVSVRELSEFPYARPIKASQEFQVEAEFSLTWRHVTLAKLIEFRNLTKLYYWPLFVYDDTGEFIPWKLEHVIVTGWRESLVSLNNWTVAVNFARLRHYP